MSLASIALPIREALPHLNFSVLEIGARPMGENEPFYDVVESFPGSTLVGFEVDDKLCKEMNEEAKPGYTYFSQAIGGADEKTRFHNTMHPMCSSLLEPDTRIADLYNNMDFMLTHSITDLDTITLDTFAKANNLGKIDFIKMDVQGPELYIFQAATEILKTVSFIVTEVEFIKIYHDQPLFGDISNFLSSQGFMFHKFLYLGGRALKPIVFGDNINAPSQHMWSDAVFVRDINQLEKVSDEDLVKSAVLAFAYGSPDLTYFFLRQFDERNRNSNLANDVAEVMNN